MASEENECCEQCRYAKKTCIVGGHVAYECRKRAPGFQPSQHYAQLTVDRIFPIVYPSEWCGDFIKDDNNDP